MITVILFVCSSDDMMNLVSSTLEEMETTLAKNNTVYDFGLCRYYMANTDTFTPRALAKLVVTRNLDHKRSTCLTDIITTVRPSLVVIVGTAESMYPHMLPIGSMVLSNKVVEFVPCFKAATDDYDEHPNEDDPSSFVPSLDNLDKITSNSELRVMSFPGEEDDNVVARCPYECFENFMGDACVPARCLVRDRASFSSVCKKAEMKWVTLRLVVGGQGERVDDDILWMYGKHMSETLKATVRELILEAETP